MLQIPEQATSTLKDKDTRDGLINVITGPTLLVERGACIPKTFAKLFDADAVKVASDDPQPYRISSGGGVRKKRKAIGKSSCFSV